MPTRNVSLTDELSAYIDDRVQCGLFENASEVVRAGLRALRQSEAEDRAKVEALRVAIQEGLESGVATGDVLGGLRKRINSRAASRARE